MVSKIEQNNSNTCNKLVVSTNYIPIFPKRFRNRNSVENVKPVMYNGMYIYN